ncbi:MAG: TetR/AcrR family transcriptional regulator [Sphingomonadaceae bacterium]
MDDAAADWLDDPRASRLVHHAARTFIARSYEGTSVEDIAAAAGVGKATVYRAIGGKAELLDAVMRHASRHMLSACRIPLDPARPAEEMLTEFAEVYIDAMYQPFAGGLPFYHVARLMISTSFTRPHDMRGFIHAYVEGGLKPLANYLVARATAGELPMPDDAEDEAATFLQLIFYTDRAIAFDETAPSRPEIAAMAHRQARRFLYGSIGAR